MNDQDTKAVWRGTSTRLRATLLKSPRNGQMYTTFLPTAMILSSISVSTSLVDTHSPHTEGPTCSGRLKVLQNCNSVPSVHGYTWICEWYHLLKDGRRD
ncbi:hypothetical protein EJ03DRAFT_20306 [Teratosphaeria nubilosa]|uniref:Uncharacterized protein n=1 Tax=Teratosphaeria nubilosa TaxID=161662 RepID=A0A6G1LGS6_9PEZI|nr:hypothetical protein EJ03DRAFT_20306 [Teratosphaeria nubilosa]